MTPDDIADAIMAKVAKVAKDAETTQCVDWMIATLNTFAAEREARRGHDDLSIEWREVARALALRVLP